MGQHLSGRQQQDPQEPDERGPAQSRDRRVPRGHGQEILLGSDSGVRGYRNAYDGIHYNPAAATPDEFFKYFQDQRTTVAVSMLPLEVKGFVEKVQAKPSEADLRNLFKRYETDEPSPTRRQPGFKEPRRIKVQYFSYKTDGPFARKLATKAAELLPVLRVTAPAMPLAAGGGWAWGANLGTLVVAADLDPAIRAEYENYRREEAGRSLGFDLTNLPATQAQCRPRPLARCSAWAGPAARRWPRPSPG